ncbi:MAG: methyltransferase domain-containing protein [Halioglobus sp.]
MYEYDEDFYRYISQGAVNSARKVLPALLATLPEPVESVLDVGCGAGAWLSVWKAMGAKVVGLDGNYLNPDQLMIDAGEFMPLDLSAGFDLNRRFDLVQTLEVAEHLPESAAASFVASLCRHSDLVMFSAAPPGQGGENHVNEQPYDYWRKLFQEQGYDMYDPIRASLQGVLEVMPWYRYNTFLYVKRNEATDTVADALFPYRIGEQQAAPDISPALYQIRKKLIRLLPSSISTLLAILKKTLFGLSLKVKRR